MTSALPLNDALLKLARPGGTRPSRFHTRLLWITGMTQFGDGMALLVMSFLETQIPCAFPSASIAAVNALTTAGAVMIKTCSFNMYYVKGLV